MEKDEIKNSDNTGEDIEKSSVDKDLANNNDNENNTITDVAEETIVSPEEEVNSLKDKLTRAYAEMENQRRRHEKEKDEAFEYGGFSFAKECLNLLDNLERSKTSLENDEVLKDSDALNKIIDHINIINKDMLSIFKRNNIEPINAINKKLDPNMHQAMMEVEDDSKDQGTIVQEIQKGFTMKDRLLRPSLVAVSKKKVNKNEKNQENKGNISEN